MNERYLIMHNEQDHKFEAVLENGQQAVLIYMIKAELFIFLHTEVPKPYRGLGIAGLLAKTALEYAIENRFKIRSYCAYITGFLNNHPEYESHVG